MSVRTTSPHPLTGPPRAGHRLPSRSQAVVAVILEDGTIRTLGNRHRSRASAGKYGWGNGAISGPRWTLWWERRDAD
jgi:hypothetical protein